MKTRTLSLNEVRNVIRSEVKKVIKESMPAWDEEPVVGVPEPAETVVDVTGDVDMEGEDFVGAEWPGEESLEDEVAEVECAEDLTGEHLPGTECAEEDVWNDPTLVKRAPQMTAAEEPETEWSAMVAAMSAPRRC